MKHPARLPFVLLLNLLLWPTVADASPRSAVGMASPCRTGVGSLRVLCEDPELAAMNREIAALYDRGLAVADPDSRRDLLSSQQRFAQRRDGCAWAAHHSAHPGVAVEECLRTLMEGRVRTLRQIADRGRS